GLRAYVMRSPPASHATGKRRVYRQTRGGSQGSAGALRGGIAGPRPREARGQFARKMHDLLRQGEGNALGADALEDRMVHVRTDGEDEVHVAQPAAQLEGEALGAEGHEDD